MSFRLFLNLKSVSLPHLTGIFLFVWSLDAGLARGQSFTVDPASVGQPNTALNQEPPPAPNDTFNARGFSGTNIIDDENAFFGFPQLNPPDINALSAGYEPLDRTLWDFIFSVDRLSVGVNGSSVNFRSTLNGNAAADLFFTNPALIGTNRLLATDSSLGLTHPIDNVDGAEVFDSRLGIEVPYRGFSVNNDDVYFSIVSGNTIQIAPDPNGGSNVFRQAATLGLVAGDEIDALGLDINLNDDGLIEAIFSLAPNSPSLQTFVPALGRNLSPADILYTDFSGQFDIAGQTGLLGIFPGNLDFFDLTAGNLGLLTTDNVDALDIVYTSTIFNIPQSDIPVDTPVIVVPEPTATLSLLSLGILGAGATLKRKLKPYNSIEKKP